MLKHNRMEKYTEIWDRISEVRNCMITALTIMDGNRLIFDEMV